MVAGCWVHCPNGAAYVLVSYGLSCAAQIFSIGFDYI